MPEADARARMARQASREERRARADRVIDNSGTLDDLRRRVDEVWAWIWTTSADRCPGADPEPTRTECAA